MAVMVISDAQMELFSAYMLDRFEQTTVRMLTAKHAAFAANQTEESLLAFVRRGVEKADSYGIEDRRSVSTFIEYLVVLGENFEENPDHEWTDEILNVRNITGEEKIKRMLEDYPLR